MAFVEMPFDDEAMIAIEALSNSDLDGNSIAVTEAHERESRDNHGYSGGSDRGGGYWPRN